jgi:hypothetical protein
MRAHDEAITKLSRNALARRFFLTLARKAAYFTMDSSGYLTHEPKCVSSRIFKKRHPKVVTLHSRHKMWLLDEANPT